MKFGKFVLISAIAILAVSCDWEHIDLGVDVNVNKKVETSSQEFLKIDSEKSLAADKSGEIAIVKEAESNIVTPPTSLPSTGKTQIGSMNIIVDKLPEIAEGAEIEPSQIQLEIDNPAEKPVRFSGDVKAGGDLGEFSVIVPSKSDDYDALFSKDANQAASGADEIIAPTESLQKVLEKDFTGKMQVDVEVSDPAKGGVKLAAADAYVFEVAGKLITPFHFNKGTKITLTHTLRDLGLNLGDYDINANNFVIYATVTSTIPFDIECTGKDVKGVTAKTDNPIKAGTISNPVTTEVQISVKGANAAETIEDVTLYFELTATQGAKINKNQSLKIDYEKVKVSAF